MTEYTPKGLLIWLNEPSYLILLKRKRSRTGTPQTFIGRGNVADDHEVASAFTLKGIFGALFKLPSVLIPRYNSIVERHLTLKSGGLMLSHHNVLNAFGEMYLLG